MKKTFISYCIFTCLMFSVHLVAAAGWSGKATIVGIYGVNHQTAIIKLSHYSNPTNCNTTEGGDILINTETQKTWFSMILAAYMAGKDVDFYIHGNCLTTHWEGPSFGNVGHIRLK